MAAQAVIRFVPGAKKSLGVIYIQCRVKPGASKSREGVAAVTNEAIELCVAAQARGGEANKAVLDVLSEALVVPKSDLQITHGLKSRDKTVALGGIKESGEWHVQRVREMLEKASESS